MCHPLGFCARVLLLFGSAIIFGDRPISAAEPEPRESSSAETVGKILAAPSEEIPEEDLSDESNHEPFAPPVLWYTTAPKTETVRVMSTMRKMLDDDWESSAIRVPLLQPRIDDISRKCPTDPRIPYGWGLFLVKHGQQDKALTQFDDAVIRSPKFLAAQKAVVWFRLDRGDHGLAGKHLAAVVSALCEDPEKYPSEVQRQETARWLGRVVGYLEGPVTKAPPTLLADLQLQITKRLSAEQQSLVDGGRASALDYWEELQGIAMLSSSELRGRLRAVRSELAAQQATLAATIEPLRKEIRAGAAETTELQKQLTFGGNAIKVARQTIVAQVQNANRLTQTSYGDVIKQKVADYDYEERTERDPVTGKRQKVREKVFKGYKTVTRQLPETPEQHQRRRDDIQNALTQAEGLKSQIATQQEALKQQHLQFRERQRETHKAYRIQHIRLVALLEDEAELTRRAKQLDAWIAKPALFAEHIHRIEPYVPWDAASQRTALLESFDPRRPATGGQ